MSITVTYKESQLLKPLGERRVDRVQLMAGTVVSSVT